MKILSPSRIRISFLLGLVCWLVSGQAILAQRKGGRILSGVVITQRNEAVEGVSLTIVCPSGQEQVKSEPDGTFRAAIPNEPATLKIGGKYIAPGKCSWAWETVRKT